MEKAILIFLALFFTSQTHALNIREIRISVISPNSINVSVNTEAVELYYFHSMQYAISGNTITVEACYVSGFGSTIGFLNNNFEISIDTEQTANHALIVKVYYANLETFQQSLQDEMSGMFSTPFLEQIVLEDGMYEKEQLILFPNPAKEYLMFSEEVRAIFIFDMTGRIVKNFTEASNCIHLSEIRSGTYFIKFRNKHNHAFIRIIVKK